MSTCSFLQLQHHLFGGIKKSQKTLLLKERQTAALTPRGEGGGGGGVLPEKLGRVVRPASQNPYPIYDQNLRFSLPYLWPDQKFDTQFMTWPLNQYPGANLPYNYFPSSDQC